MLTGKRRKILLITLLAGALLLALWQGLAVAQGRVLYWGSRGNDVIKVQSKLNQWGYYRGPIDGYYGSKTVKAVKQFQYKNGLRADGVVGPKTWAALGFPTTVSASRPGISRGITDRDQVTLLARIIEGEAADEPYLGKVAVGAVILNRVQSPAFPNTLAGVIYQPLAFESVANGQAYRPLSEESLRAAQQALSGFDPTGGALYFWNPAKRVSSWIWSRPILTQIGRHVFAR
ncbi:MAG: spore cortex-lytic enzyme [Bacillota bacterium]|uniref:spore cortex-lytic enzyme n=1 Tax=Desulfurispora thermophila TaxID=265470 RepID=UPI00037EAE5D|nr:spore cortex-lytic enzyme [Desulfurispora thermophila]